MPKGRLEAFSDGVIAIIITIMVLELKVPHGTDFSALAPLWPVFLSYVLSFIYVGIYWNNHHHMLHAVKHVGGKVLWANLHLLFWLSLIPFVTRWMGESHFGAWPVAAYGMVLLLCAVAWQIELRVLLLHHGRASILGRAIGANRKEWLSIILYGIAIGAAFANAWVACALYALVAAIWIVPDRRFEREITKQEDTP
jgi:uncharacterized membrane protein